MDRSEAGLDRIEAQRSTGVPPTEHTESVPKFLINIRLSDLFDPSGEYVLMSPKIFGAVIAGMGKEEWRRYSEPVTPLACLKSDGGDSVIHLAAAWGHLQLVESIVSECPSLLLELNSRDQLPLHVAVQAGHIGVVKALVATVTFLTATLSAERKERILNVYVVKDKDGDTALHLACKDRNGETVACLVNADQRASFLANKDGISPLYMAVEAGAVSLVKAMLKVTNNDGLEGRNSNLGLRLEGRKYLVHAALKARSTDLLRVILKECPSLEDERDEEGRTCLSFGASIGFSDGIRYLLRRSSDSAYVCNNDGSFPIHVAVEKRHNEVVNEIRRRCPNSIYLLNKQGQNILHIASKVGNLPLWFFISSWRTHLVEKQDVDGNTPLHLATINWHPRTLFNLVFITKQKYLHTRNNNGLTALDIAESNQQPNYIFMERVTLMVLLFYSSLPNGFSMNPGAMRSLPETRMVVDLLIKARITKRSDPQANEKNKDYVNTLLVVAALVATVTFAAGFTIPGGFNSSGPNLGMATLASDRKLLYFMIFDILAMQSSILTIATLIWAQLGDPALVQRSINVALPLLFFSLLCMPVAFYCGVFVAFAHVKGLVIFLTIASVIFVFLMIFVLGPHVILQIPGIPKILGPYILLFVMFVNENSNEKASALKTSGKDLIPKKESS